jgi:hypothetical protein
MGGSFRKVRALLRPRISLRNLLLLMTCVALAVVWWQTKQRIGPMRADIVRLRTELGYLTIDDPANVIAISTRTGEPAVWQWRIYLPPGRKYRIRCASGFLPDQQGPTFQAWYAATKPLREAGTPIEEIQTLRDYWFEKVTELGETVEVGPADLQGEFTLQARLVKDSDEWKMKLQPGGAAAIKQPNGDWLSDERSRGGSRSDLSMTEQKSFAAEERVILLHIRRPVITEQPGSWSSTSPVGDADSIVLWIESEPAAAAPEQK